ncbi:hypothetical protein ONE63_011511 [Megalurothrips usitatus]|uniref:C2H2-type domain-containing protein n=1 Tax=Megalurothrips usitatus TaxID=439358 RepID=A0AAV7X327_9NEOP|nr:hypothetical protein ONE63_011511 [Megalurothrips usitatus]
MSGPAYLLVSIFQAPSSVHVGEEDTTGQKYRTSCVASTNTQWYKHSACTNSYLGRQKVLDYDIVIDHIPDTLQAFVDSLSRRSGLHSEITIKDEPVCVPELNACTNLYCARTEERKIVCGGSGQAPEEDIEEHHAGKEKESSAEVKKCNGEAQIAHSDNMGKCKRSTFTLLQCPKCPKSFKYSLRVNGLNSIIAHVYDCHERSTGYCISTIKKRYANLIINDVHPRKGLPSNVTSKV